MATKKKTTKPKQKKKKTSSSDDEAAAVALFFSSVEPTPEYAKHLIECRCSLPQFRSWDDPPNHKFVVFSELDDSADVKRSYAQCNNCGIIHRVTEVGKSVTIKKEELRSLTTTEELEGQMPPWLAGFLRTNECDLATWQEAKFIVDHKLWGRFIVLAKEREDDVVMGKICQILGDNLYKVESFERDDGDVILDV